MAYDAADWIITRATGDISYVGDPHAGASPSYATGIELHRALMDFADDATDSGDDELSIIDTVPSSRGGVDTNITLIAPFNLDDASIEHIYDTSITQDNGDTIYDGVQVFGNSNSIQVIQNGAILANDFWNEAKMITAVSDLASSTTHRFLVKVRVAGSDIDGRRLVGTQRVFGTTYTEFSIGGGTNRGNNVLALNANTNNNNNTAEGTIATYNDIVNDKEGYSGIDADGNTTNEFYYSDWKLGSRNKNGFYERAQWLQREGSASILYGLDSNIFRGITHKIIVAGSGGAFVEPESLSWGSGATAGTAQLLAIDSTVAAIEMFIQLLTGVLPVNADVITGNGGATAIVNGAISTKTISIPFVGSSTGSAILGAYGLGIGSDDLSVADRVQSLDDAVNSPPNNVSFTVNGLIATEDYVLVGNENAGSLDLSQLSIIGNLTGVATSLITCATTIPVDTPSSGTIRVQRDSGTYTRINYSSYSVVTFTITPTDFSSDNVSSANNLFISYIDELIGAGTSLSFTTVYNSDRTLVVRRRYGGVPGTGVGATVPAETTGTLTAGGGSATPARLTDE